MTTILCTGGAGFVGSHYVDYLLKKTDWDIVVLSYAHMTLGVS
jgi:nucleoside-diphosphate-sugar epimerase